MITIFSIPKPFRDNINIIQMNAIQSWLKLFPKCEIILFGDEEGLAEVAKEFNLLHIPKIGKNEFGTPLLNSVFNQAQKIAKNDLLVYINCDIILMSDFIPAIQKIKRSMFLMSGRRWDLDVKEEIDFNQDWEEKLRKDIKKKGRLRGFSGIDYFVFPRNFSFNLPSFAVGRPGWDNWVIYRVRSLKIPMIDATQMITAVHQNHPLVYHSKDKESQRNYKLAGGFSHMLTLRDADWILTPHGLTKPPFPRRIFSILSLFYPWRLILVFKRRIKLWLG